MFRLKNKDKKLLSYLMTVFNITLLINMIWYLLTFLNVKQVIRLPIVVILLTFKLGGILKQILQEITTKKIGYTK